MIQVTYRCNNKQCNKIKGESNHWIGIRSKGSRPTILPVYELRSFEDCGSDDEHYCGPACAIKRLSEIIDELRAKSVELIEIMEAENKEYAKD